MCVILKKNTNENVKACNFAKKINKYDYTGRNSYTSSRCTYSLPGKILVRVARSIVKLVGAFFQLDNNIHFRIRTLCTNPQK